MWPFLPEETKKLAVAFSEIAQKDSEAWHSLSKAELYPQSIFFFQQSVEKAAKVYGLLSGNLQPTKQDLSSRSGVSHRSLLAMVLGLPKMIDGLASKREALLKMTEDIANIKAVGAWPMFEHLFQKSEYEDSDLANRIVEEIQNLEPSKYWSQSLELAPNDPFTAKVMKMLNDADIRDKEIDSFEINFQKFINMMSRPKDIEFFLNLYGRVREELVPLIMVSMAHEQESRYPAIESKDLWDVKAYTAEKGLIKNHELLYRHTVTLCASIQRASNSA